MVKLLSDEDVVVRRNASAALMRLACNDQLAIALATNMMSFVRLWWDG